MNSEEVRQMSQEWMREWELHNPEPKIVWEQANNGGKVAFLGVIEHMAWLEKRYSDWRKDESV